VRKGVSDGGGLVVGQWDSFYVLGVVLHSNHHVLIALGGDRLKGAC
jgi:hypothetical protein